MPAATLAHTHSTPPAPQALWPQPSGLASHTASAKEALQGLIESIDPQAKGKQASEKKARGREAGDPVEQFAKPCVVIDNFLQNPHALLDGRDKAKHGGGVTREPYAGPVVKL